MQQSSSHTQPDANALDKHSVRATQSIATMTDHSISDTTPNTASNMTQPNTLKPRIFSTIPTHRPKTPLLDTINTPADLDPLDTQALLTLADELREFLLYSAGVSGGHFGANLGVVELTIALHYLFDTPKDKLVWDVGHQAYAHKVLTGRREQLVSIRSKNGLTAFPERSESEYDTFGVGHSSTAISAGLGMSLALAYQGEDAKVACVVGDGAMTGGMAFEAMNDAVQQNANLTVILNDNDMSISCAIGGFCRHLAMLWDSGYQVDITEYGKPKLTHRPNIPLANRRDRHSETRVIDHVGDNLFKAIGFQYFGPFDGHDLPELLRVIQRAKALTGPVLVHIYTTKGKGFSPAEADPVGYHAIGKLPVDAGELIANHKDKDKATQPATLKYSQVFGEFICDKAQQDSKLMAITPAMEEGSGMSNFARQYPEQFFDVAIAEQHAVTLAGGMATQGVKPIVAIYSTFLQRGYDQLIHDIALQQLDVMFAIDRAGLVGEDGATHAGVFDLAFMRCVPNMIIATPKDENECYQLLNTCYEYKGASAVRYPRGTGTGATIVKPAMRYKIGEAVIEKTYTVAHLSPQHEPHRAPTIKLALLAYGPIVATAHDVAKHLINDINDNKDGKQNTAKASQQHINSIIVVNMRWVKPLDTKLLDTLLASGITHIVTLEEHAVMGGAGSAVNEYLLNSHSANTPLLSQATGRSVAIKNVAIKNIGIPDRFIEHGSHDEQLADCQLDKDGIINQLQHWL